MSFEQMNQYQVFILDFKDIYAKNKYPIIDTKHYNFEERKKGFLFDQSQVK